MRGTPPSEGPFDAESFLKELFEKASRLRTRANGPGITGFDVERDRIQPISDAAKRLGFDVAPVVVDPITFDTILSVKDKSSDIRFRFFARSDPRMYRER